MEEILTRLVALPSAAGRPGTLTTAWLADDRRCYGAIVHGPGDVAVTDRPAPSITRSERLAALLTAGESLRA